MTFVDGYLKLVEYWNISFLFKPIYYYDIIKIVHELELDDECDHYNSYEFFY
jgi:hypothetical protein